MLKCLQTTLLAANIIPPKGCTVDSLLRHYHHAGVLGEDTSVPYAYLLSLIARLTNRPQFAELWLQMLDDAIRESGEEYEAAKLARAAHAAEVAEAEEAVEVAEAVIAVEAEEARAAVQAARAAVAAAAKCDA